MSRLIYVHNPEGTSQVYTRDGRIINAHQTRDSTSDDPVTARLLRNRRLIDVTHRYIPEEEPVALERPSGNASTSQWHEYATIQGIPADELEGATRAQIIAKVDEHENAEHPPQAEDIPADPMAMTDADGVVHDTDN